MGQHENAVHFADLSQCRKLHEGQKTVKTSWTGYHCSQEVKDTVLCVLLEQVGSVLASHSQIVFPAPVKIEQQGRLANLIVHPKPKANHHSPSIFLIVRGKLHLFAKLTLIS